MRRTTIAVITAGLLLAGCGSSDGDKPEPSKPAATTATTKTPALSKAEITRRCINAFADRAAATEGGEVATEPRPKACESLTDSEYLDATFKGTQQANKAARQDLQDQIDKAAEEDAAQ